MRRRGLFLALLAPLWSAGAKRKHKASREDVDPRHGPSEGGQLATMVDVGATGVAVRISDGPAALQLRRWAADIGERGATQGEASMREAFAHGAFASGAWPERSWHEYQRLAAGTGQVDSAALLLEYGVAATVVEAFDAFPSVRFAAEGNANALQTLLDENPLLADARLPDGTTALHAAALSGCHECVESLFAASLDAAALIDAVGAHGLTALHVASAAGHVAVIQKLASNGADVDARHGFANTTALILAAENGHGEAIQALCALGADAEAATTLGGRAVHAAAQRNRAAAVKALAACGADVESLLNGDTTPLYIAAQEGFAETVEALLRAGANVDFSMAASAVSGNFDTSLAATSSLASAAFLPNLEPGNGATALHAACENGHVAAATALLVGGAEINSKSMLGVSPLQLAAQHDQPTIAKLLLDHGANVDQRSTSDGAAALYHAASAGFGAVVAALLEGGAAVDLRQQRSGATSLFVASGGGHYEIVSALLAAGADVDAAADDGSTPLLAAVSQHHPAVVDLLLRQRPNLELAGPDGQTALLVAAAGDGATALKLLAAGASVDARVLSSGATALHLAARLGDGALVTALVQYGADVAAQCGETMAGAGPLYVAAASPDGYHALLALLDAGADPDAVLGGPTYDTPLLAAVERGDAASVKALLSEETDDGPFTRAGADLGSKTSSLHQAPLLLAVARGHVSVARALLNAGANCALLVAKSRDASVPPDNLLDVARARRDHGMLQLLSAHGDDCDVSVQDM